MSTGRHAIVLAAGAAVRFGGGKLTAIWQGEPLIRWALRAALAADVDSVVLVIGSASDDVRRVIEDIACPRLQVVEAERWADGISASLKTGLRSLPRDAAAVAIFLGDMPAVDLAVADRLLDAVIAGAPAARARSILGPAHPTAFAAATFPELFEIMGDQGGRVVLDALGAAVATIEVQDPGAVFDIDRPEDLKAGVPQP